MRSWPTSIDRRDLNAQLAGELQVAQQRLQTTLRESAAGATPTVDPLPLRPFRGELDWPSAGPSTSGSAPSSATADGVEIAADEGTPVHAIHEGTVAFAGTFAGFGNLIIVDHGAQNFSLYGHLLETAVSGGAASSGARRLGRRTVACRATGTVFRAANRGRPSIRSPG